jgi:hypothetical protein
VRRLRIGNAAGFGVASFLVLPPVLPQNRMAARETALARVGNWAAALPIETLEDPVDDLAYDMAGPFGPWPSTLPRCCAARS